MIRELDTQEAMAILGGQDIVVTFTSGAFLNDCGGSGSFYYIPAGSTYSSATDEFSGDIREISEREFAHSTHRAGERNLDYQPITTGNC